MLVCLLPLLYINVKSTHDWGDDFAQYILQAKSIATHSYSSMYQVAAIEQYSPQFRPVGFPSLLVPFHLIFGDNIFVFEMLNAIFLILLCMLYYRYNLSYENNFACFLYLLVFAYNPAALWLKQEVMPELFFTLILFAAMFVHMQKMKYHHITLPILISLLLLIKYIGVVFILAYLLQSSYQNIKLYTKFRKTLINRTTIKYGLSITLLPLLIYFFVNDIIFQIPRGNENWFGNLFFSSDIFSTFSSNLVYYKDVFTTAFEQEVPHVINIVLKWIVLIVFVFGFIMRFGRSFRFKDYFFVIYIVIILCYPYSKGGYRFLFPVFPIILMYIENGFYIIIELIAGLIPSLRIVFNWLPIFIIISYYINVKSIVKQTNTTEPGPQDEYFTECVDYISTHTTKVDCFLFPKPWAFTLYTDRSAVPLDGHATITTFPECLKHERVNYILACFNPGYNLFDENLINLINIQRNYHKVWNNSVFALYKKE